jgi:hypothetical protein
MSIREAEKEVRGVEEWWSWGSLRMIQGFMNYLLNNSITPELFKLLNFKTGGKRLVGTKTWDCGTLQKSGDIPAIRY